MKYILLLFVTILTFSPKLGFSQCDPIALEQYKKVYDLVNKSNECGKNGDYKKQLKLAKEAAEISEKIEQSVYKCYSAVAWKALTEVYLNLGDFNNAMKNAGKYSSFCDKFRKDDCKCKADSQLKTGLTYSAMGNDSLALLEYKKALDICKNEQDQKLMEALILQITAATETKNGKLNEALNKLTEAENLVHEVGDTYDFSQLILGRCYTSKGIILYLQSNCDDALPKLLTGLELSHDEFDHKTSALCYYYIGRIYDHKAKYTEALSNYQDAIFLASKMGDTVLTVDAYNFTGSIFTSKGMNKEASDTISKSFKLAKSYGYKKGMADALNIDAWNKFKLISDSLIVGDDIISQAKTALALSKDINYNEGIAEAYNNIETYYENLKDYKMAKKYALLALKTADSIGYIMVVADAYNDLGDILFKNNAHMDSTLKYYNISIEKSEHGSYNYCGQYNEGRVDSYNKIGNVYLKRKQKDKALEHFYRARIIAFEIEYKEGYDIACYNIESLTNKKPKIQSKELEKASRKPKKAPVTN
jgi:tetratricopeptide (TPR) repeat protein